MVKILKHEYLDFLQQNKLLQSLYSLFMKCSENKLSETEESHRGTAYTMPTIATELAASRIRGYCMTEFASLNTDQT